MALIPYLLRFASDPVRQELEESGFIQRTKVLREEARSLLTCEGASHVTLAQLDEELGRYDSDNFIDREAARRATEDFASDYYSRLLNHEMNSRMGSMRPAARPRNITQVVDRVSAEKRLEDKQQLKVQKEEDTLLFATPDVKFEWTWEAIVQLWKATRHGYLDNPELAAVLFQ
ncbi:hypothetical protein EMPS_10801 [Entomortierella parvispora]|uniref:Uncharacterized protein n=1 Tax=Entomortierella parvispora TaxID=205924 RepID=A0A9P3M1P5_9FUNG|nr:hypothetical protein EMPS_10801 [Entomortierella parvispora]